TERGFHSILWYSIGQEFGCGNTDIQLHPTEPYQLKSPNYPSDVTEYLYCNWLITSSSDMQIKVTVQDLHIGYGDGMTIGNVQTDGSNNVDGILNIVRGVKVHTVYSSSHVIQIEYWTNDHGGEKNVTTRFWFELQQVDAMSTDCHEETEFRCEDGDVCVDRIGVCDVIMDCPDRSDEENCPLPTCPANERCANETTCLLRKFHCDGIIDCTEAEDENNCDLRLCPRDCTCKMNDALIKGTLMMHANCTGHPNMSQVIESLPRMTNGITLRRESITDLPSGVFENLPFLVRIDLERNLLTRLEAGAFDGLAYLQVLKINVNNLVDIDDGVFATLASIRKLLRLDGNKLVSLREGMFRGLDRLLFLRLGRNQITSLKANTFRHLSSLISLDLGSNQISSVEPGAFEGLTNLLVLHFQDNQLKVIEANTFSGLQLVNHLDIGGSPWTEVKPGAFNGLESLEILNMRRRPNQVQEFQVKKNEIEHLQHLMSLIVDDPKMCCLLDYKTNGIIELCFPSNKLDEEIPYLSCNRIMHNSVLRVFIWCLGISALIGNAGIIMWRLNMKDSGKRSQSVLILNLAVSDLIMGLYMVIVAGADVHYQDDYFLHAPEWKSGHLCKFAGFLSMLSSEASVFFITMISIDRFLCVVFPFGKKWLRLESARMASVILWAISLIISVPPLFLQDMRNDKNETFYGLYDVCVGLPLVVKPKVVSHNNTLLGVPLNRTITQQAEPSWIFSATVYLGINFACCLVVMGCYIAIAFVVIIKLPAKKLHKRKDREHRRREMTMATRMLLIVGTDFCCWMPVIIMGILSQSGAVDIPDETYAWVVVFVIPINSAINPYLYTVSNANAVSLNCCNVRSPGGLVDSVRMKPLTSQTKDTQAGRSSRSGTQSFL
ncbi:G-protein coupled receptor GRL101-like, partial [Asterias rubens]|uniref:G-protein coupled receptor GRL101-like n=1 Tax=Asterias rubens TaxID=7604 RepID=UPI001454F895